MSNANGGRSEEMTMTRKLMSILFLGLAFLLVGCGTVAHGTTQRVPVMSSPAGALVTADCGLGPRTVGETPVVVKVSRKADRCLITVQKEGYDQRSIVLHRHLSGWVWGNVFLPYTIPGVLIDLFDGGAFYRAPVSVHVKLYEAGDAEAWRNR
jgi:hypothetical protein